MSVCLYVSEPVCVFGSPLLISIISNHVFMCLYGSSGISICVCMCTCVCVSAQKSQRTRKQSVYLILFGWVCKAASVLSVRLYVSESVCVFGSLCISIWIHVLMCLYGSVGISICVCLSACVPKPPKNLNI